jgi:TRAP-type C4-dicarboxylate transport system permease small subunit
MDRIWGFVERLFGMLALLAFGALIILPSFQVFMRDAFSMPIIGIEEATRWGLIMVVFLGLPLLVRRNEQIRFAEMIDLLPKPARFLVERATLLATAVTFGVIAYYGVDSALRNTTSRTPTLDIPFWLFISPMIIGMAVTAIGCLWLALRPASPPIDSSIDPI